MRLTRAVIRERKESLVNDPRVKVKKAGNDWVEVALSDPERAIELARLACRANRAPAALKKRARS